LTGKKKSRTKKLEKEVPPWGGRGTRRPGKNLRPWGGKRKGLSVKKSEKGALGLLRPLCAQKNEGHSRIWAGSPKKRVPRRLQGVQERSAKGRGEQLV